jgi:hypothetical protein
MADPAVGAIDDYLPAEVRSVLEERFWHRVEEGSMVEALSVDDEGLLTAPDAHPALFADHGVVHARDIAAGVVDLAETVDGVLLPSRPDDRRDFVVALAVVLAYLHDAGMYDPTSAGRRIHAIYAAHLPFSGEIDDVLDRLAGHGSPVVERIAAVDAVAPFGVPRDVVLRELVSLAVAHSKSTVPAVFLGDFTGLRSVMRHVVLADLDHHRGSAGAPAPDDELPGELCGNARWYADPVRDAYAWLDSPPAAHRALADDAVDAVRLVRAADALRQRGTTLKTAAGYEIFIDADTGEAVFALRTAANDRLLLLRVDSPLSAGEANLRGAFATPDGHLRIAFHRGRFSSPEGAAAARAATARVVADIGADVLGAFAVRRPSPDLPAPARDPATMRLELERPSDEPSFADAVADGVADRDAALARHVAVVADLEDAQPAERERYYRGVEVQAGSDEAAEILSALGACGLKEAAIDSDKAFEDVRRVRLDDGEVLVEAGSPPSFVYVALGPGLRVKPLGGYEAADVAAWLPIGITGVVRQAERNSTVVAGAPVEVLMIPGELFHREWFRPYEQHEIGDLLTGISKR